MSELWKRALGAVLPNHSPPTAFEQLTKLANERFDDTPWLPVTERDWSIRSELWGPVELQIPERKHADAALPQFEGPLVVVEFKGRVLLVDGTHRVNYWRANGFPSQREVLVVAYTKHAVAA
jgi:hypothetical protein